MWTVNWTTARADGSPRSDHFNRIEDYEEAYDLYKALLQEDNIWHVSMNLVVHSSD